MTKLYLIDHAIGSRIKYDTTLQCFVGWHNHSWMFYAEKDDETKLFRSLGRGKLFILFKHIRC